MGEQAARKRERRAARTATLSPPAPVRHAPAATSQPRGVVAALVATVVVLGLAAAGFLVWLSRQSDDASASVPPGPPVVRPASSYHAVYTVEDTAGPQLRQQTDVVSVRRPEDVRVEHRDGAPPGGKIFSGTIVNHTDQTFLPDNSKGYSTPLTAALDSDVYSDQALAAAADAGKIARLGLASVLGNQCTLYLYRSSGTEALSRADDNDKVEVCVTSDDILLRQLVTLEGKLVRRAEVVQLQRSPSFPASEFASAAGQASAGAQATEKVTEGKPAQGTTVSGQPPDGFKLDNRLTDSHQELDGPLLPFYIEGYSRGGEFVVSQQLLVSGGDEQAWQTGGTPVTLSGGRPGAILYHPGYVEVQTDVGGYPARVVASSVSLATWFAGTLRASG